MKNYVSFGPSGRRRTFHFFDDAQLIASVQARALAEQMKGAVFLRPDGEHDWAWKGVPQIRGERLDAPLGDE